MSRSSWASATVSDRSRNQASSAGCARVRYREAADQLGYSTATFNPFSTRLTRIGWSASSKHRIGDRRMYPVIAKWLRQACSKIGHLIETEDGRPAAACGHQTALGTEHLTSIMSMINGATSGGSDAPPVTCVVRYATTPSLASNTGTKQSIPCRPQGEARSFWIESSSEKTRLIEFVANAIANRRTRGLGKPETFDFLGSSITARPGGMAAASCSGGSQWPSASRTQASGDQGAAHGDPPRRDRRARPMACPSPVGAGWPHYAVPDEPAQQSLHSGIHMIETLARRPSCAAASGAD